MANITSTAIEQIIKVVKTAKLFGIESFIIEQNKVRGIDDAKSIVIFDADIELDVGCSVGINRLDVLFNRLMLFDGQSNYTIECVIDPKTNEAQSLVIKANRAKVEYKCAKIRTIQAPKGLEVPREYMLEIGEDVVSMISRADTAMKAETLNIICNDSDVEYSFIDSNGDVFEYAATSTITSLIDDDLVNLAYKYPVKLVMLALKNNTTGNFYITRKGMLNTEINGVNVFIPSKQ